MAFKRYELLGQIIEDHEVNSWLGGMSTQAALSPTTETSPAQLDGGVYTVGPSHPIFPISEAFFERTGIDPTYTVPDANSGTNPNFKL